MIRETVRFFVIVSALSLAAALVPAHAISIGEAKSHPDFAIVTIDNVTMTKSFTDRYYVSDDTGKGILILDVPAYPTGSQLQITGEMNTWEDNLERCIVPYSVDSTGSQTARPFGMLLSDVGGRHEGYDPATGAGQLGIEGAVVLNNVGSYVRVWGRVVRGAVITDGQTEMRMVLPMGFASPHSDSYLLANGIVTLLRVGGKLEAVLKTADAQDVQVARQVNLSTPYSDQMIYIPAGMFRMGASNGDSGGNPGEKPYHEVFLDGYWIGKHEVTRGEYRKFIEAGGYSESKWWSDWGWYYKTFYGKTLPAWWEQSWFWGGAQFQTDNHPVVGVSWYEAEAFCNWAGLRLPTEAEWEKAARWDPVNEAARIWPWGSAWNSDNRCNWQLDTLYTNLYTAPVGSYPSGASYFGCMDMAGNCWEWVYDWMDPTYYQQTPSGGWVNPKGPVSSAMNTKVLKGGSYWGDFPGIGFKSGSRCAARMEAYARWNEYPNPNGGKWGFRVAR